MEGELIQALQNREDPTPCVTDMTEFADNLSEQALSLIQFAVRQKGTTKARRPENRNNIIKQFEDTFHLIGGVPRLALWADQNPTQFFLLYSKLIPNAAKLSLTEVNPADLTPEALKSISTEQLKRLLITNIKQSATEEETLPVEDAGSATQDGSDEE